MRDHPTPNARANSNRADSAQKTDNRQLIEDVRARTDLAALIGRSIHLKPSGGELRGMCPFHAGKSPKLDVNKSKGTYYCRSCEAAGDCFSWVMWCESCDFPTALRKLAEEAGLAQGAGVSRKPLPPVVVRNDPEADARKAEAKAEMARSGWRAGLPIACTPAETYLNTRGLFAHKMPGGVWSPTFRFDPRCLYNRRDPVTDQIIEKMYVPALIAAVQNVEGRVVGLDRIYLQPDGRDKLRRVRGLPIDDTKKMLGVIRHNALRLGPATKILNIAEGLETTATVAMSVGCEESAWGCLSLGNWIVDLPAVVEQVNLWVDSDESDRAMAQRAIEKAAEHYAALRRPSSPSGFMTVKIIAAPEGLDWNDVLRRSLSSPKQNAQVAA